MENQDAVGVSLQFGEFCNSLNLLFLVNDNMAYQKGGGGGAPLKLPYVYVPPMRMGMIFMLIWSGMGHTFCPMA